MPKSNCMVGSKLFVVLFDSFLSNFLYQLQVDYPVLRQMARDYLAIPGTSCIAERSFSLSGRTDDPRRRRMDGVKFGSLQKVRAAYNDGRLDADLEEIRKYAGDFTYEDSYKDD